MRPTKTLSAIVLAVSALALASAGPASAEVLCKEGPVMELCPAGKAYGLETVFTGHTGGARFVNAFITAECESDIAGDPTENAGAGNGLKGNITELDFAGCTGCESLTAEGLPYKFHLLAGPSTITLNQGGGGGVPRIKFVNCTGITCIYGAAAIVLKFKSSTNAATPARIEVGTEAPVLQKQAGSNAACPATITWTEANYEITEPLPIWLTRN